MQKVFKDNITLDKRCYSNFNLSEDLLMEHAANTIFLHIKQQFYPKKNIVIVCGPGNNGADGLALARLLHKTFQVSIYMPLEGKSEMSKLQLKRTHAIGIVVIEKLPSFCDIIVDCLFGSGLNKSLEKNTENIIRQMSSIKAYKIACDIPSGLNTAGNPDPVAFKADYTITMGALKTALFNDNAKGYVGEIEVANLGVPRKLYEIPSNYYLLEKSDLELPIRIQKNSHKRTFGHLAVYAGEKEGAAIITGKTALNFGVGLVTLISKNKIDNDFQLMQDRSLPKQTTAIAIGMGLGNVYSDTEIIEIIDKTSTIIDADIFYSNALRKIILLEQQLVLTPHPKEFASLLKILNIDNLTSTKVQENRIALAEKFTNNFPKIVLLLKGANPIIAYQGNLYINNLGTPALSKAGSGDVLSGLIGALLAQGHNALESTINASLAHTLATENILKKQNNYSLTPSNLIESIARL